MRTGGCNRRLHVRKSVRLQRWRVTFLTANYSGESDLVKYQEMFLNRSVNIFNIFILCGTRCSTGHLRKVNGNRMHNTG